MGFSSLLLNSPSSSTIYPALSVPSPNSSRQTHHISNLKYQRLVTTLSSPWTHVTHHQPSKTSKRKCFASSPRAAAAAAAGDPPAKALRKILESPGVHQGPACFDALSAKLVERAGFQFCFMSGFSVSAARLGLPDVGLISYGEMVDQGYQITQAVSIPVIGDGDNGYGNEMNVKRTVKGYIKAGFAGIILEDQVSPKACGHTRGRKVVSREEAVMRIKAAIDARNESGSDIVIIARTDSRQAVSLEESLWRSRAFADAGADILFIDALASKEEMKALCEISPLLPKMANMLEGGGKTPILTPIELEEIGFKIVAYPLSLIGVSIRRDLDPDGGQDRHHNPSHADDADDAIEVREIHALSSPQPPSSSLGSRGRESWEVSRSSSLSIAGSEAENFTTMSREFNALVVAGSTLQPSEPGSGDTVTAPSNNLGRIGEEELLEETNPLAIVPDSNPIPSPRRAAAAGSFGNFAGSSSSSADRSNTGGGGGALEEVSVHMVKRGEVESKIAAWQTAEIAKINNRFKREDVVINGWESEQIEKSTARLKKIERKLEEKRARAVEKMQNEVAKARRKAEEKRASAEAKRGTKVAKVVELSRLLRAVGRAPSKRSLF